MGFCTHFHQTWTPGYGAYIDPNRLSRFHRRLSLAKKVCAIIFAAVALTAIVLLLYLLYTRCNGNIPCTGAECEPVRRAMGNSSYNNTTDAPITEAFAGPFGPFMHAGNTVGKKLNFSSEEARSVNEVDSTAEDTTTSVEEVEEFTEQTTSVKDVYRLTEGTTSVKDVYRLTEGTTSVKDVDRKTEATTSVMEVDYTSDEVPVEEVEDLSVEDTTSVVEERGESLEMDAARNEIPETEEADYDDVNQFDEFDDEGDSSNDMESTTVTIESMIQPERLFGEETFAKIGNKRDTPGIEDMRSSSETSTVLDYYEDCNEPDFQCSFSLGCVSTNQRCDGKFDCNNYPLTTSTITSMEKLKEKGFRGDRSDELNCTCGENYFVCDETTKSECIHNSLVCDSIPDCSNGKDETSCVQLSEDLNKISRRNWSSDDGYGIQGHVLVRVKGSWHPYCSKDWTSELAERICHRFDHKKVSSLLKIRLVDLNKKGILPVVKNTEADSNLTVISLDRLLLLCGEKPCTPMTPLEEMVTETYVLEGLNCTVAYLSCAKL